MGGRVGEIKRQGNATAQNMLKAVYIISVFVFVAANAIVAGAPANYAALVTMRVLQAAGASSTANIGPGTVADSYPPRVRALAISVFMLGPQIGVRLNIHSI